VRYDFAQRVKSSCDGGKTTQSSICVDLSKLRPFGWYIGLGEDRLNRALGNACIAVDTGFGINNQHIVIEMKSLDRTNKCAVSISTVYARLYNHVSHFSYDLLR
jgi:hypothetical protein